MVIRKRIITELLEVDIVKYSNQEGIFNNEIGMIRNRTKQKNQENKYVMNNRREENMNCGCIHEKIGALKQGGVKCEPLKILVL